jgi:hypothetical protein
MATPEGEIIMCAGCMEMVTIIHDDSLQVDPQVTTLLKATLKQYGETTLRPTDDPEMGLLLILVGASMLDWTK